MAALSRFLFRWALVLFLLFGVCGMCPAEPAPKEGKAVKRPPGPPLGVVEVFGDYANQSKITDGEARMSYSTYGVMLRYWKVSLRYEARRYFWDKVARLPFSNGKDEPWDTFQSANLGVSHNGRISEIWGYFAYAGISSYYEDQMGDGLGGTAYGGVTYCIKPNVIVSAGIGGGFAHDQGLLVPILGLRFNPWAKKGFSGNLGLPNAELKYNFTPRYALKMTLKYDPRICRLKDASEVEPGGYVQDTEWKGGLFFEATYAEHYRITLGAQYLFNREFITYDSQGGNKTYYDMEPAWGGMLSLCYIF